jgi:hypothetical protein
MWPSTPFSFLIAKQGVDAQHKAGHDVEKLMHAKWEKL